MPRIAYTEKQFRPRSLVMIRQANEIIKEYAAQGFSLTLRQLYYQFVARDLIPNTQRSYKSLGSLINDARLAGHIDWEAIEDRTRNVRILPHWDSPTSILNGCAQQYRIDKWDTQPVRVEVWIEKDALIGVIERVCETLDVPYFSCRGYVSQSEMWRAAERFVDWEGDHVDGESVLIHLGDHDPSGIDMTRDIQDRLELFGAGTRVVRVALNMDQIEEFNPPPNPAKTTDSRYQQYMKQYGDESWELDALDPPVIAQLITGAVIDLRDEPEWSRLLEVEMDAQTQLGRVADQWDDVVTQLEGDEQ